MKIAKWQEMKIKNEKLIIKNGKYGKNGKNGKNGRLKNEN